MTLTATVWMTAAGSTARLVRKRLGALNVYYFTVAFFVSSFLRAQTDHVLISKQLNKAVSRVAYRHDFTPAEFCDRSQRLTSSFSDHWPIAVEFDLSMLFGE
jgi:hypothetical protein